MDVALHTKRLNLIPMTDQELAETMERETDPHMKQAYGEMLSACRAHPEDRLFCTQWRIRDEEGATVGGVSFKGPAVNGAVELGYGIEPAYRGNGYAGEAAEILIKWAFSRDGVYWVEAEADPGNAASLAILEKLGFTQTGTGREGLRFETERPFPGNCFKLLCLGMCFGAAIGISIGKLNIALPIGSCLGLLWGNTLDKRDQSKRAALRTARKQNSDS